MNGDLVDVAAVRTGRGTDILTLTTSGVADQPPLATLTVDRPAPDRLRLDGRLDGRPVTIALQRKSLDDFLLLNRGFHWVQEQPFFK